jgi:hypothetical protein
MKETWKDIPNFEGIYQASNLGGVRSLPRVWSQANRWKTTSRYTKKGQVLRPALNAQGYPTVVLGRKYGTATVHSLVLKAFIGPPPKGHEVRHNDGIRSNARLSNLCYGTRLDNIKDSIRHGSFQKRCEKISKLTKKQKQKVVDLYYFWGFTYKELGQLYAVTPSVIGYLIRATK